MSTVSLALRIIFICTTCFFLAITSFALSTEIVRQMVWSSDATALQMFAGKVMCVLMPISCLLIAVGAIMLNLDSYSRGKRKVDQSTLNKNIGSKFVIIAK